MLFHRDGHHHLSRQRWDQRLTAARPHACFCRRRRRRRRRRLQLATTFSGRSVVWLRMLLLLLRVCQGVSGMRSRVRAAVSAVGGGGGGSTSTLAPALLPSSGTPTTPTIEASLAPIELGEEDATWIDGPIDQTQAEPDSEEAGAEGHAEGASRRAAVTATMPVLAGGGEDDEIVD